MSTKTALQLSGSIVELYDTVLVKENYQKREFVVAVTEDVNGTPYTNYAKLQVSGIKCETLNSYKIGDSVKVSFNIRGAKYQKDGRDNFFTYIEAWRIERN